MAETKGGEKKTKHHRRNQRWLHHSAFFPPRLCFQPCCTAAALLYNMAKQNIDKANSSAIGKNYWLCQCLLMYSSRAVYVYIYILYISVACVSCRYTCCACSCHLVLGSDVLFLFRRKGSSSRSTLHRLHFRLFFLRHRVGCLRSTRERKFDLSTEGNR